jgi:hypothetical protein
VPRDKTFAVKAAVAEYGSLIWEINNDNVTNEDVASFIAHRLADFCPYAVFIRENMSNQQRPRVEAALELCLGGRCVHASA